MIKAKTIGQTLTATVAVADACLAAEFEPPARLPAGSPGATGISWGTDFTDTAPWPCGPDTRPPALRHRIGRQHLLDNLEWREGATGYQCSSHAHFSFVTEATGLVFEVTDFANYGPMVTPIILNGDQVALQLPPLPTGEHSRFIPLFLPPGTKRIKVINSLQTNASWGGAPKNYTVRAVFSDVPLRRLTPDPVRTRTRLVIYGDSIAAGGNADMPGVQAWGPLLRQTYDVAFEASGWKRLLDDADKLPEVADRIAAYRPDIVWLAIGVNDYQGLTPMDKPIYGRTYGRFLDLLHERLPRALVIAQSPLVKADESKPNSAECTLADYRTAIKAVTVERPGCRYADGAAILGLSDLADGVHPGTAGMTKYAELAKGFLKSVLPNPL